MGVKISFDATGTPQEPTLILAYPNGDKIGQLNVNGILVKDSLNKGVWYYTWAPSVEAKE